jgi:lipoprotein-anchoring transpeptidase ErfK/SrfK
MRGNGGQWLAATVIGTTLMGSVLAGCTAADTPAADAAGTTPSSSAAPRPTTPAPQAAAVTTSPAAGATGVNPSAVITASVAHGTITGLRLTNAIGRVVKGTLSADRATWTAAEPLGYGKTYTWSGTAVGTNGKPTAIGGAFTTLTPRRQISGQLNVGDAKTYGVAMPIALTFSSPVSDRAAVEKVLTVKTSVPTTGSWAWLDSRTVHWRPRTYYTPGTHVSVGAKLYGLRFAPGVYGRSSLTANFTIGRAQIVKADTRAHRVRVYVDGKMTANYPASFGLDSDPRRVTRSGTHVVVSRSETVFMTNPKFDYYNLEVHWAVRISNNGEFIHAAPWSVGSQGKRNVSHGCVNLSTANATAYYHSVLVGDPVEVTGSSQRLGSGDGNYYDWTLSWAQWQAKSALA